MTFPNLPKLFKLPKLLNSMTYLGKEAITRNDVRTNHRTVALIYKVAHTYEYR